MNRDFAPWNSAPVNSAPVNSAPRKNAPRYNPPSGRASVSLPTPGWRCWWTLAVCALCGACQGLPQPSHAPSWPGAAGAAAHAPSAARARPAPGASAGDQPIYDGRGGFVRDARRDPRAPLPSPVGASVARGHAGDCPCCQGGVRVTDPRDSAAPLPSYAPAESYPDGAVRPVGYTHPAPAPAGYVPAPAGYVPAPAGPAAAAYVATPAPHVGGPTHALAPPRALPAAVLREVSSYAPGEHDAHALTARTGHANASVVGAAVAGPHAPPVGLAESNVLEAASRAPHGPAPWGPPNIAKAWPYDEYLFDGGDHHPGVNINPDWKVYGLDLEDTVVHYDTLDGRTLVKPSNCVKLYAPRFAAVRKITGLRQYNHLEALTGAEQPVGPRLQGLYQNPEQNVENLQLGRNIGTKRPDIFLERNPAVAVAQVRRLKLFEDRFKLYEDFLAIKIGVLQLQEKPRLIEYIEAANVWVENRSVQVLVKEQQVFIESENIALQTVDHVKPQGAPCMRIIKVASKCDARPGEIVDFTLRFDNTGTQPVGNVTILDNLTTRLEYVPDSAQCSVKNTNFYTEENEAGSLVLRWEIIDPIKVGEGGVIRFQCKVR